MTLLSQVQNADFTEIWREIIIYIRKIIIYIRKITNEGRAWFIASVNWRV